MSALGGRGISAFIQSLPQSTAALDSLRRQLIQQGQQELAVLERRKQQAIQKKKEDDAKKKAKSEKKKSTAIAIGAGLATGAVAGALAPVSLSAISAGGALIPGTIGGNIAIGTGVGGTLGGLSQSGGSVGAGASGVSGGLASNALIPGAPVTPGATPVGTTTGTALQPVRAGISTNPSGVAANRPLSLEAGFAPRTTAPVSASLPPVSTVQGPGPAGVSLANTGAGLSPETARFGPPLGQRNTVGQNVLGGFKPQGATFSGGNITGTPASAFNQPLKFNPVSEIRPGSFVQTGGATGGNLTNVSALDNAFATPKLSFVDKLRNFGSTRGGQILGTALLGGGIGALSQLPGGQFAAQTLAQSSPIFNPQLGLQQQRLNLQQQGVNLRQKSLESQIGFQNARLKQGGQRLDILGRNADSLNNFRATAGDRAARRQFVIAAMEAGISEPDANRLFVNSKETGGTGTIQKRLETARRLGFNEPEVKDIFEIAVGRKPRASASNPTDLFSTLTKTRESLANQRAGLINLDDPTEAANAKVLDDAIGRLNERIANFQFGQSKLAPETGASTGGGVGRVQAEIQRLESTGDPRDIEKANQLKKRLQQLGG